MESFVKKEEVKLPQEISLISLIQSRYSEIKKIINEFQTTSPKLASQKLPIHMRRRAASHNVNRLPSRTRNIVIKRSKGKDLISEGKEKKRKQSKKYRNQNKVNLSHAVREAKPDRSLLHIWFVKRFKMINLFNQIIPDHNTTKNQRKIQRMSKIGCTHFYLPQFSSIIIRIKDVDLVSKKLSEISKTDLSPFFGDRVPIEGAATWVQFYKDLDGDIQSKIIGPGYLIYNKKQNFLIIWCHTLIHEEIFNFLFENFRDTKDEVSDGKKIYQLLSLIGSENVHHLKKVLGDCGSFLPDDFTDGISLIENWNFLSGLDKKLQQSKRTKIIEDTDEINCLIIHMMKAPKRNLIFLSVPYSETKNFWHRLVRNRTHLVGGLRDIQMLTSEMRYLHYPTIGYPDLESNSHHEAWNHLMKINFDRTEYFLLRDQLILNKLKSSQLSVTLIEDLLVLHSNLTNSLVYIEMICINRGVPEKGDIICLPVDDDLQKYIGREKIEIKLDETGYGPVESIKISKYSSIEQSSRKVIGLVEFGYFSLDLGTGRGFGAIAFNSLKDLIKLNSEKMILLVRSKKSETFRFVEIFIDNFNLF